METCEVCGLEAPAKTHPCRFEKACRCWYGEPCEGRRGPRGKAAKS